jgi:hypothetical protein
LVSIRNCASSSTNSKDILVIIVVSLKDFISPAWLSCIAREATAIVIVKARSQIAEKNASVGVCQRIVDLTERSVTVDNCHITHSPLASAVASRVRSKGQTVAKIASRAWELHFNVSVLVAARESGSEDWNSIVVAGERNSIPVTN